jgi:electron transfer flavoprotein alpha subunit
MAGCVLAYAESRKGQFRRVAFEAVRAAGILAKGLNVPVAAVAAGDGLEAAATTLGRYGAKTVVLARAAGAAYAPARWARTIAAVAKAKGAVAVLIPASIAGKELGPLVAAELDAGYIPDATGLSVAGGAVQAVRPVYAGKALATVQAASTPVVVCLRPKAFAAGEPDAGAPGPEMETRDLAPAEAADAVLASFEERGGGKVDLTEADVIVSGGRGMKGPENFKVIEELAAVLNAAVGASRSAVDAGWRPHADQVGQTGKTVSPELYIACGISGAIQHLAGMGSSRVIVAINKDAEAPIFKVANYGVVGDLFKIVPVLKEAIKKVKE